MTEWRFLKPIIDVKGIYPQYTQNTDNYFIKLYDGDALIDECILNKNLNLEEVAEFEANYKPYSNKNLSRPVTTDLKIPKVSIYRPEGSSAVKVSHDWCNPTTWYFDSIKISNEVMDHVSGNCYSSNHVNWIDLTHGYLYDEDSITGYNPIIKVDDIEYPVSGYTIDYHEGLVNFNDSVSGMVTATYNYATTSTWYLGPLAGKILVIEHAEIQFAADCTVSSPIYFEIWITNPVTGIGKVLYQRIAYKNERDLINSANLGQGSIQKFGNLPCDILVFPFNYNTVKVFKSSQGAELRIKLKDDIPLLGSFGTASFYILSTSEI